MESDPVRSPLGDVDTLAARVEQPIDVLLLTEEPILASLVAEPVHRLPGPGFWASVGWTLLLMGTQLGAAIFVVIPLTVFQVPKPILSGLLFLFGTMVILVSALALSALLFGWRTPRVLGLRVLRVDHALLVLLAVLPMAIIASEVGAWAAEVLPSLENEEYAELATWPYLFVVFVGCVLPAMGEEIFFRGFLGRGLLARYGIFYGALLSSLMFGLVHIDPPQAVGVMAMGVVLQGVFIATRSLFAPILLHGLNNALSFAIMKYDDSLDATPHSPWPVVLAAGLALATLGVLFYQMRLRWILPDGREWSPGYVTGESPPASLAAANRVGRPAIGWTAIALVVYLAFAATVRWAITNP